MNFLKLAQICHGKVINPQNFIINHLEINSAKINYGDVFIAIKGKNKDGHDFIKDAIKKGAKGLITSKKIKTHLPYIIVKDTTLALGQIAAYHKNNSKTQVIAITGSTGKTTTKELIYNLLKTKYKVLKTEGNQNNHLGVPLTLLKIKNEDFAIVEMGMNHSGEISYLSKLAQPSLALITNIGSSHIGNLKSQENILKAKLEIKDGLKGDLIVSGDDSYLKKVKAIKIGFNPENDFRGYNLKSNFMSTEFNIKYKKQNKKIKINLPAHLVSDVLLSIYVAIKYNINIETICQVLKNFHNVNMRLNMLTSATNTIINDCYNSSFESLTGDLTMLQGIKQKKLLILGDIAEAGIYSKTIHENLKPFIEKLTNYEAILVGKEMLNLQINKTKHFKNYEETIKYLKTQDIKNTLILIKASRSMAFENITNYFLKKF